MHFPGPTAPRNGNSLDARYCRTPPGEDKRLPRHGEIRQVMGIPMDFQPNMWVCLPSGSFTYRKSPFCSWENQLFRLGHLQWLCECLPEGNPQHKINTANVGLKKSNKWEPVELNPPKTCTNQLYDF